MKCPADHDLPHETKNGQCTPLYCALDGAIDGTLPTGEQKRKGRRRGARPKKKQRHNRECALVTTMGGPAHPLAPPPSAMASPPRSRLVLLGCVPAARVAGAAFAKAALTRASHCAFSLFPIATHARSCGGVGRALVEQILRGRTQARAQQAAARAHDAIL